VLPRRQADQQVSPANDIPHAHFIAPSYFELREDETIGTPSTASARSHPQHAEPVFGAPNLPRLIFSSDSPFIRLDAIAAKYPDGRFDAIFADPPYFLPAGP
jgi:hypothetical protein